MRNEEEDGILNILGGTNRNAKLKQFPVTLAYAVTDNKCQGKTLEYIIIVDLRTSSGRGSRIPTSAHV
jgi:hypothetical protein